MKNPFVLLFLKRLKESKNNNSSINYGYRNDFLEEMHLVLIEKFGYIFFEKGFDYLPPTQIEYFLIYLNILNKELDKDYKEQQDNFLRICLAGVDRASNHKPEEPNYYDFDIEKYEEFLARFGLDLEITYR